MIRTARKFLPAVAVIAVLGTGWASAATFDDNDNSKSSISDKRPATSTRPTVAAQPAVAPAPAPQVLSTGGGPSTSASPTTTVPATRAAATEASPQSAHQSDEPAGCATGEGTFRPATEAEMRTIMTRVWLLCQSPSFFGTSEAGMEVRADGRWSKLERRPNGSLARLGGWENEGSWSTVDTSAMNGTPTFQVNFNVDGAGGGMTVPAFGQGSTGSEVTKVRLSNNGYWVADYVPASPDTKLSPVLSPPAAGKGCEAREEPYAPTSEAEFRTVMTRAWLLCGAPSFFGTDEDGLEIRADGRWFKLYRASNNSLARGRGPGEDGSWETFDTSVMNGRPTYQLNLNVEGGGSHVVIPNFASRDGEVSKVRLNNNGVFVADYIPAPARTSITGS